MNWILPLLLKTRASWSYWYSSSIPCVVPSVCGGQCQGCGCDPSSFFISGAPPQPGTDSRTERGGNALPSKRYLISSLAIPTPFRPVEVKKAVPTRRGGIVMLVRDHLKPRRGISL